MTLIQSQTDMLRASIISYHYPSAYFDFNRNVADDQPNIQGVERKIRSGLTSGDFGEVKNAFSNVLYWGYATQSGRQLDRVKRFREKVASHQLVAAATLFRNSQRPLLTDIKTLKLPELSLGISFASKIRMFLDPDNSAVLDKQIMKMAQAAPGTILSMIYIPDKVEYIPITKRNAEAYEAWCSKLREISTSHFEGKYRVVDVERGFFQLIQSKKEFLAAVILRDA